MKEIQLIMKFNVQKKAKFETAKRMLNDGLPIESIVKYTGLTEKEIKVLMI